MTKGRRIPYSEEELTWVKENCTLETTKLHQAFIARFNRQDVSAVNLNALRKRNGWRTGRTGRFEKGHDTYKGGPRGPNRTSFKKGNTPINQKPLYSERRCKDGYIMIKVPEPNPYTGAKTRYLAKHIWIWEQNHGKVPKNHVVIFKDGNKEHCEIDNLTCVPRGVLPVLNRWLRAQDHPPEVKPTLITVAQIQHQAKRRARDG